MKTSTLLGCVLTQVFVMNAPLGAAVVATNIEDVRLDAANGFTWNCDFDLDGESDFAIRDTGGSGLWVDVYGTGTPVGTITSTSIGGWGLWESGGTVDLTSLEQEQLALDLTTGSNLWFGSMGYIYIFEDQVRTGRGMMVFHYGELIWGGEYGHGWVDMTIDPVTFGVTIHGFAYESNTRTPVTVAYIPESSTWLYSLGVTVFLFKRRRLS